MKATALDFGGHPLALELLAGYLNETQKGDVRQRDHIRAFLAETENPRHDHARRVMESYEKEWLAGQPALLAIMQMVGLFDRPASDDSLKALRAKPTIAGLTDLIVDLGDAEWRRAITRLRGVRLLAPPDPNAPDALDAHPLVREWFGERLRQTNEGAWKAVHGRLYEHLRDTTKEGEQPKLEDLAPLYQAITHGCHAGRHHEALYEIYWMRICRRDEFYTSRKLGAIGSNLAAISWFFDRPFDALVLGLAEQAMAFILSEAAFYLRTHGRLAEALAAENAGLRLREKANDWRNASIAASNLSEAELLVGDIRGSVGSAVKCVELADRAGAEFEMMDHRTIYGAALHAGGRGAEAEGIFADAGRLQRQREPTRPLLYSLAGFRYYDLLLDSGDYSTVRDVVTQTLEWAKAQRFPRDVSLGELYLGRALLGLTLAGGKGLADRAAVRTTARVAYPHLSRAADGIRAAEGNNYLSRCLLAQAAFHRGVGDWASSARDLDEVEEIGELGPMRLYLCDMALERARLAFAQSEAFAPLNRLTDDSPPDPEPPGQAERDGFHAEAVKQLAIAADYIEKCGYHRRDEELAELQPVLRGERTFASLPPHV